MSTITCIEDLRLLAKRRVPKMFYDYVDSGAWTESTYRDNQQAFERIKFRQRVMVDMANRQLGTTLMGQQASMPLALAPTGLTGMQHADGEILAARAAEKAGVPYTLSTMSICSLEDVADAVSSPFWFQLYVMRDRDFINNLIDRAKAVGCSALVLTADLQILGQRHADVKNGLSVPPKLSVGALLDLLTKWRWCLAMAKTKHRTFGNIVGHVKDTTDLTSLSKWTASQFDPSLSWDDVKWIKERWGGPLIIKGILEPEDAELAVNAGADAIVVSNHGGRQLDGAAASIDAFPAIAQQVGDWAELYIDGGIRSGQDVLRSIALGAKGAFIGRPFLYGLGAMGEEGVSQCIELIRNELDITLAFCGLRNIADVDSSILRPGSYPTA
ncbi:L-lactate dehydrogenase [Carnimonas sp. R-84981]|uniref:alpha-hydroxy acid oxidase n=1 Tax=Carnimonas bestiolae TaxID=3402172 RepID=UPI003EDC44B2